MCLCSWRPRLDLGLRDVINDPGTLANKGGFPMGMLLWAVARVLSGNIYQICWDCRSLQRKVGLDSPWPVSYGKGQGAGL
ncbi:hypothetical protein J6590_079854 [Homalodisca vitripennis]|nr:hypothetical protein J6590_079854 [Homalodisca vitripennis]